MYAYYWDREIAPWVSPLSAKQLNTLLFQKTVASLGDSLISFPGRSFKIIWLTKTLNFRFRKSTVWSFFSSIFLSVGEGVYKDWFKCGALESADKFLDGMAMPKFNTSQGFFWRLGCCAVAKTVGVPGMVLKLCGGASFLFIIPSTLEPSPV